MFILWNIYYFMVLSHKKTLPCFSFWLPYYYDDDISVCDSHLSHFSLKFSVSISHASGSHMFCHDFQRFSAGVRLEHTLSFAFGKWPTSGLACLGHFYCRRIGKRALAGVFEMERTIDDGHWPKGTGANDVVAAYPLDNKHPPRSAVNNCVACLLHLIVIYFSVHRMGQAENGSKYFPVEAGRSNRGSRSPFPIFFWFFPTIYDAVIRSWSSHIPSEFLEKVS